MSNQQSQQKTEKKHTGYKPRPWQAVTHGMVKRHNVLVFHRRGGKTVWSVNELIDQMARFNKNSPLTGEPLPNPRFAYIAPTIGQAEQIAWDYFKQYLGMIPGIKFNESKLRITLPHPRGTATIYLFGAENFERMRGLYLDGYILDEYADMHPDVRDKVLLPTLSDRKGWEIIIGTPKGDNAFKALYDYGRDHPDWFTCHHSAEDTGLIDAEELKMLKTTMSDEAYRQEYLCDFGAAPSGYFYQKQMDILRDDGKITGVPHDASTGVCTFWDLGYNDSGTVWFIQEVGREIHVIDYIENNGVGLEWYVNEVHNKPYGYSKHFLPHDVEHHEISTGRTRRDYLENLGLVNVEVVPRSQNISEDIHATRVILPKCYFDKIKCEKGIKALRAYRKKYDAKTQTYSNKPVHDWASHGADGFRQFAVSYEPGFSRPISEWSQSLQSTTVSDYDIFNL